MRDAFIAGVGLTPVGEHWGLGLRELGARAIDAALGDAQIEQVQALYVGNMLSGQVSGQENLATFLADAADLTPVEALRIEAACASGAAAVRAGAIAVAGGACDVVVALGIEKMTDVPSDVITAALATASDQEYEASLGLSFVGMAALIMRRYMYEWGCSHERFAPFIVNAHKNAMTCGHAMYRFAVSGEQVTKSPVVASPLRLLDAAPVCDGAAALVICSREALRPGQKAIKISASAVATDTIALASRPDLTWLKASELSARRAYATAKLGPTDMHLFEAHDAFSIMSVLSLEACGFAPRGQALDFAAGGGIALDGTTPISTFGGLKARGHPVGASGAFQIAEACLQLRCEAGPNQVKGAKRALTQSIGGHGSIVVTHILEA
jgi:acetyl-CoA C-acetyltransferase